jgi:CHAT domain-containing protein/tetratricopeptide (TPR) repeat protein
MGRGFFLSACISCTTLVLVLLSGTGQAQSLDTIQALDQQAIDFYRAGKFKEARLIAEQTLAIREKMLGPDDPDLSIHLGAVATYYMLEGRIAEAEPHLARAVAIMEKNYGNEHPLVGVMLNKLGELYVREGRHSEAEATLKRALASLQKGEKVEAFLAATLNNLAVLYEEEERIGDALPLMEQATALREQVLGPENPEVATSLDNLGTLYGGRGDHERAEALLKRALAMRERLLGAEHPDVGRSLNNIAMLYLKLRRIDEAETAAKHALSILKRALPADHPDVATVMNSLAQIYEDEGKFQDAEAIYRQVLAIREKALPVGHPHIAQSVGILSTLALARRDWPRALDYVRRASRMWIALSRKSRTVDNGELARSSPLFRFHVLVAYRAGANDSRVRDESYEIAQWAERTAAASSLVAMSARQATGNGSLAQLVRLIQDYEKLRDATEPAVIAALGKGDKEWAADEQSLLTTIERNLRPLYAKLDQEFPDYDAFVAAEPLSIAATQELLHEDEALVQFLTTPQFPSTPLVKGIAAETFAWVVSKREARWIRVELAPDAIADTVAALRCGLDYEGGWSSSPYRCAELLKLDYTEADRANGKPLPFNLARAHALYKGLFDQVEDLIEGKQLFIVPSGALNALPLQVLVTKKPIEPIPATNVGYARVAWLGTRNALTVLPAVLSLKALRAYAKPTRATDPYIGFGNPLLTGRSGTDKRAWDHQRCPAPTAKEPVRVALMGLSSTLAELFRGGTVYVEDLRHQAPLPETADELCAVARAHGISDPDAVVNLGERATEARVKALSADGTLSRARVVHFATHGLVAGETALFSKVHAEPALLLTPPETASYQDDGLLTASEVGALKLDADCVILSACNTAVGNTIGGDALSGLARAFFYAGARALLVSHWPVDSQATVALITRTFETYQANPKTGRAEALRRAMATLIKAGGRTAHPEYWAPFVVVGEGVR